MKTLPTDVSEALKRLGANIRLARLRRQISQAELARSCQMTAKTLYEMEAGAPGTAISKILNVLRALELLGDAAALADPDNDEHGKLLERARSPKRGRSLRGLITEDDDY